MRNLRILLIFVIIILSLGHHGDPDQHEHHEDQEQPEGNLTYHHHHDPLDIKGLEYYDDYTQDGDSFWLSDKFKQLSEKLGFDKKKMLNMTDIKNFLYHLAGYDEDESKIPQGLKDIYNDYLKDFGEGVNTNELKDKLNITKLFNSVKEYFIKTEEPSYLEKIKGAFNNTWTGVSDMFMNLFGHKPDKNVMDEDKFMEQFNTVLEKLGMAKKDKFKSDEIKKVLHKWFITDKDSKSTYPESVKEIFNRLMSNIPDEVNLKDLKSYLTHEGFIDILKNITTTHYGEGYFDKFKDVLQSGNMTEILSKVFNFTMSHEEL
jgi:hypothetical protein